MDPSPLGQIDWSGLAISVWQWLSVLAATKGVETALEPPLHKAKEKAEGQLDKALRQGKDGAVQEVLRAATWPAVQEYRTEAERETAWTVLKAMAEDSESEALRSEFAEQVQKSFIVRTQVRPDTKALARTYGAARGLAPSQKAVEGILERFFDKVREGLLLREEFGFLREYEQLSEARKHTELLETIAKTRTGDQEDEDDRFPIPPPDSPPRIAKAVERMKYVKQLAAELRDSHIAIVSGLPGTGKSILAGRVADVRFGDSKYFWHSFAKGQDISSFVSRLSQFLEFTGAVPRDQMYS